MIEEVELLILGAGSAGFGAAYRALINGVKSLVLIDKNPGPGGTSVFAGVNNWEPGVSGNGIHKEIAKRLMDSGNGFVGKTTEFCNSERRYAVSDRCDDPYESTLMRAGLKDTQYRRFHFEPEAMSNTMIELLHEVDKNNALIELYNSSFISAETENRRVNKCTVMTPQGIREFSPKMVIDCSADIALARNIGCDYSIGEDSKSEHGEALAPEERKNRLNGISLCFRIMPIDNNKVHSSLEIPPTCKDIPMNDWVEYMHKINGPVSCFSVYPHGGINVNMLPTMNGDSLLTMSMEEIHRICIARVHSYWHWLKERCNLNNWYISDIFPMLGIREYYRLRGEYILTHNDIQLGYANSLGKSHTIAMADHPADIHGSGGCLIPPNGSYEIPYECILPKEFDNLLVACRGSSFSHLASSSARLSRTMISLGEAAGNAAAYCIKQNISTKKVPEETISTFKP